jgi:energy-coupling factor transport system permease protein
MSARYDLYQPGDSYLHRLDPRTKFALVACGIPLLLLFRNLWIVLAALATLHGLLLGAGIARSRLGWVWRVTLPPMVMIAVLWVLFYPGEGPALLEWWRIRVTATNVAEGLAVALRIGALAFLVFVWLYTTDQATLVRGLVALGLPYEWGLTLAVALRYLPTMAGVFGMISEAQQARALDLTGGGPLRRARAYIPIVVAMLISSLRTAENLSRALESRALGAAPQRTYLRALRYGRRDLIWTVAVLLLTVLLAWARFALGFGTHPLRLWG